MLIDQLIVPKHPPNTHINGILFNPPTDSFHNHLEWIFKTYIPLNNGLEKLWIGKQGYHLFPIRGGETLHYSDEIFDKYIDLFKPLKEYINELLILNKNKIFSLLNEFENRNGEREKEYCKRFNLIYEKIFDKLEFSKKYLILNFLIESDYRNQESENYFVNYKIPLNFSIGEKTNNIEKRFITYKNRINETINKDFRTINDYIIDFYICDDHFHNKTDKEQIEKLIEFVNKNEIEEFIIEKLKEKFKKSNFIKTNLYDLIFNIIFRQQSNRLGILPKILTILSKKNLITIPVLNNIYYNLLKNINYNENDSISLNINLFKEFKNKFTIRSKLMNEYEFRSEYIREGDNHEDFSYLYIQPNKNSHCYHRLEKDNLKLIYNFKNGYCLCYINEFPKISRINKYNRIFQYSANVIKELQKNKIILKNEDNPTLYGLELELSTDYDISELNKIANMKDLFFIAKSDASVSGSKVNKYELVTLPMSLKAHRYYWAHMFSYLDYNKFDTSNKTTNGIHIHVHKNKFKDNEHLYRYLFFINRTENYPAILLISERDEIGLQRYCYPIIRHPADRKEDYISRIINYNDRHIATNCSWIRGRGGSTLETRIFKGIVSYNSIIKSLEFKDALIEYTSNHESTLFNDFYIWLKSTSEYKYYTLKEFLEEPNEAFTVNDVCNYSKEYKSFKFTHDLRPFKEFKDKYIEIKQTIMDKISKEFFGKLIKYTREGKFNNAGILALKDKNNEKKSLEELVNDVFDTVTEDELSEQPQLQPIQPRDNGWWIDQILQEAPPVPNPAPLRFNLNINEERLAEARNQWQQIVARERNEEEGNI